MHSYDYNQIINEIPNFVIDSSSVIINCGHFLIISDDNNSPPVYTSILNNEFQDEKSSKTLNEFGDFSNGTFELGVKLLLEIRKTIKSCYLTILINDWQRIQEDNDRQPNLPNKYRNLFFSNFNQPPELYTNILKHYEILPNIWIGCNSSDYFFFKETNLRDKFKRHLKMLSKRNFFALNDQKCLASCNEFQRDLNSNSYYHVSSKQGINKISEHGKVGCAGEISQLIFELNAKLTNACLINILPKSCMQSVTLGTEIAFEIYPSIELKVINIFPSSKFIKDCLFDLIVHEPAVFI